MCSQMLKIAQRLLEDFQHGKKLGEASTRRLLELLVIMAQELESKK